MPSSLYVVLPLILKSKSNYYTHFIDKKTEIQQGEIICPRLQYKWWGFPGDSDGKESACNVGDPGSIPGLGRSPGERSGYSLQYSGLENSMDRGVWQVKVLGFAKSQIPLRDFHRIT